MTRARISELAKRGEAASAPTCLDCDKPLRREGETVFFVCFRCSILWTRVPAKGAVGWVRSPLPIAKGITQW